MVDRWAFRHTEQDLVGALDRLAAWRSPPRCRSSSSAPAGWSWTACWPPAPGGAGAPHRVLGRPPALGRLRGQVRPGDSYKLADYLRTDGHRLRRLDPPDPGLQELQALVRLREDHVRARTAASNQLGALLEAHWPGPKAVFFRLASPIALAFLTDYPTPQAAARLGEARMASFCRRHSYRGGKPRRSCWPGCASAPTAPVGIPPATLAILIGAQVQLLRALLATIAELEAAIATRVACHPRAKLLASLPGVGTINLAQLLAEVGPILDRVDSAEQAAAECGAAPVTKASGKTSGVYFRWAANRRARKALTAFAHNARMQSPWAGRLYADARARGKRNPHATRIVARAWLRVIWACWHTGTPYDPARPPRRAAPRSRLT